jgi:hypothetical protein
MVLARRGARWTFLCVKGAMAKDAKESAAE